MRFKIVALQIVLLSAPRAAGPAFAEDSRFDVQWHETMSPHFRVLHEKSFLPQGFIPGIETIHSSLSRDFFTLAPWMLKERITLYLYADQKSYVRGQFHPPGWSNGLAYYDRKLLVLPAQPELKKLLEITAHEMTHLLFESFWNQREGSPPHWLNEGLAMYYESKANRNQPSQWYDAMKLLTADQIVPFPALFSAVPGEMKDQTAVSIWYVEAYSVVYFMRERRPSMTMIDFCRKLREGEPVDKALWLDYRYPTIAKFQAAWMEWLNVPRRSARAAGVQGKQKGARSRFSDFTFHSFRDKN